jgi:hypothetical protein
VRISQQIITALQHAQSDTLSAPHQLVCENTTTCRLHAETVMTKQSGHMLITHPSGRREVIPLQGRDMRIGSAADNDLVLSGPTIAAHHASIRCTEHGDLMITTAGLEIELPRASAGAAVVRIGGYALHYAAGDAVDHASGYVMRQANQPIQYARTDEAALLSALLARDESAGREPRLLDTHEAVTIEMPMLSEEKSPRELGSQVRS